MFWSLYDDDGRAESAASENGALNASSRSKADDKEPDEISIYLSTDIYDREDLSHEWDREYMIKIYHRDGKITGIERWWDYHMCGGDGTCDKVRQYPARAFEREVDAIMADIIKA